MENLDFGKKLIEVRKQKGLTQADVAEKSNITIRTIQRIESGDVKPRSSTIKIISENLEFDFFETSNQNSKLKSHTILWYVKDLFNFKTNAMKKISILTACLLLFAFTFSNLFSSKAQSTNLKNEQKTVESSPENEQKTKVKNQDQKIDFSKDFDSYKIEGDYVFVTKNSKHGLYKRDGNVVIPCDYTRFQMLDNHFIYVTKYNKHGIYNLDGKEIIPCDYTRLQFMGNNFVFVTKYNKQGLMNLEGDTIVPCEFDRFQIIENSLVLTIKHNKQGLMNLDGKTIIPCEYDAMKIEGSIAIVTKNGKTEQIQI